MFECDCKEGFVLHEDGYSCSVENSTTDGFLREDPLTLSKDGGEDILYQKDAIFSAKLDALNTSTSLTTSTGDYVQFVTPVLSPPMEIVRRMRVFWSVEVGSVFCRMGTSTLSVSAWESGSSVHLR
ncbi:hypothetical protein WDU94_015171 [Cyamophila willieti]